MGLSFWDRVVILLTGKHIALLGPRGAGKTTMHYLLIDGHPPEAAEQTVAAERVPPMRNKKLGLTVHRGLDVPGSERAYNDWRHQFEKSEIVFYLFDAKRLMNERNYADRVGKDGKRLQDWDPSRKQVILVGTHADTDDRCKEMGLALYTDIVLDQDVIVLFRQRANVRAAGIGSLLTEQQCVTLLRPLLQR